MQVINPLAVINDTDLWAVLLDGRVELFLTQAEAVSLHHHLAPTGVEDTAFASIGLLPPGKQVLLSLGHASQPDRLSRCQPTDLLAYAAFVQGRRSDQPGA